jgi:hypothetical protein
MSKSKQKGTSAESAFVKSEVVLEAFPHVERRALAGVNDMGDISGMVGLAVEIKNHKTYKFPEWIKETEVERINAKADYGILVVKPNGVGLGSVENWWAVMPVGAMISLLRDAGYGTPKVIDKDYGKE